VEKADLSKDYWNPKRKLGVTTHFSEINLIKEIIPEIERKSISESIKLL